MREAWSIFAITLSAGLTTAFKIIRTSSLSSCKAFPDLVALQPALQPQRGPCGTGRRRSW